MTNTYAPIAPNDGGLYEKKSRFALPNAVYIFLLVLLATIFPQVYGLVFAREGLWVNGENLSPTFVLGKFDSSQEFFFLIGFIPAFVCALLFIVSVLYTHIKWLKYAFIVSFAVLNFLISLGYVRLGFKNLTHAIYHSQSAKINAIDVGILCVLAILLIILVWLIILQIIKHFVPRITVFHNKKVYIVLFLLLGNVAQWIFFMTPLLDMLT